MASDAINTPSATGRDHAYAVVKAGISAIPIVGGPAAELLAHLIEPPLAKRRNEWMELVGEKLAELDAKGVDITELGQKEEFVSAVLHASHIALRTHQAEKREALRNAIFNVAAGQSPGDALEHMFFEWVDSLSVTHIQVLKLFQSPPAPPGISMGGLNSVLEFNMPHLRGQRSLYDQVWRDLYSRGLINTDSLHVTMSGSGLHAKRTTDIGDAFVRFISEPAP